MKEKNTRVFAGIEGGLTRIKIEQLISCSAIAHIVVSTDDETVMAICREAAQGHSKPVEIIKRPSGLATSSTTTDSLIEYVPEIIASGTILWTHVTSPFVTQEIYGGAINKYHQLVDAGSHDSLMSVTRLQTFLWSKEGPVNYRREEERWPRTQTLPVIHEINSAIFIAPRQVYAESHDRIGEHPYLLELPAQAAMDIDWEPDFALAELMWETQERGR